MVLARLHLFVHASGLFLLEPPEPTPQEERFSMDHRSALVLSHSDGLLFLNKNFLKIEAKLLFVVGFLERPSGFRLQTDSDRIIPP